ncbi:MAG: hypothetical protein ACLVBX_02205 [Faecalibacterium prausnitzii]
MPSKTEEYLALAQRTANGLTRYWESWTDYLTTASRLYKYPFADQLTIYNGVGSEKFTASELYRCPNLSYNEDVLRERSIA